MTKEEACQELKDALLDGVKKSAANDAKNLIAGTARSMGITVKGDFPA